MGKDKYENEDLIKYGQPEDVWFHVDDLSSAHVYLRMKPGMSLDDLTEDLITDCASLVKANSIQGCKVSFQPQGLCFLPVAIGSVFLRKATALCLSAIICIRHIHSLEEPEEDIGHGCGASFISST